MNRSRRGCCQCQKFITFDIFEDTFSRLYILERCDGRIKPFVLKGKYMINDGMNIIRFYKVLNIVGVFEVYWLQNVGRQDR